MARGEIAINEAMCRGCGYCAHFCARKCLTIPGDKFNTQGYLLPLFSDPDRCNGCGICGWLCPHFAIEVYVYAGPEAAGAGKQQ